MLFSFLKRIHTVLHDFKLNITRAINAFIVRKCAGCGASCARSLCTLCAADVATADPCCFWLNTPSLPRSLPFVYALKYTPHVANLIYAIKERGRVDLACFFAPHLHAALVFLTQQIPRSQSHDLLLVPIPSARGGTLRRGYSHVELLLQKTVPQAMVVHGLSFVRTVQDQAYLNQKQRAENMQGAMIASNSLCKKKCILVDDIYTSGASVNEGIRALAESGADIVGIVCLAKV